MAWAVLAISLVYLGLLFAVAAWGDRRADAGRSVINNPWVYTLSLAVYCTSWTFYGSVTLAATNGLAFLFVYLGPTLVAFAFPFLLHKPLKVAKTLGITSIADFLAARYGKSAGLAGLVTVVAVLTAVPYLALQLKALSSALDSVGGVTPGFDQPLSGWFSDKALLAALAMAGFSVLFGTRHVDATETHQGMVLAVAFESLVKLACFLIAGLFIVVVLGGGLTATVSGAVDDGHEALLTFAGTGFNWADWAILTALSGMAFMVLPRQFQVAVIENVDERHLRFAAWAFPAYLLLINLLVLPVALVGLAAGAKRDGLILLALPLGSDAFGANVVALITYLGGFSAATAMIIVSTVALATMISNDLVVPALLRWRVLGFAEREDFRGLVLGVRRWSIVGLLLLSYLFHRLVGEGYGLASIGLISFVGAAQFAPALLAATCWRDANKTGALAGIVGGALVWAYTLVLPAVVGGDALWVARGPWAVDLLRPQALFGLEGLNPVSHATAWSLALNVLLLVGGSLIASQSSTERMQALLYVEVYERQGLTRLWRGEAKVERLVSLLARFLGASRAKAMLRWDAQLRGRKLELDEPADAAFVERAERQLARAIGAASARAAVASVVRDEVLGAAGLLDILDETSQVIEYSQRLEQKSRALEKATEDLRRANERLRQLDRLKDDFLATVSHELRTPLTSIRSFSEILLDSPDIDAAERAEFLGIIVRESERLTRLINNVLDLSKIESGRMDWHVERIDARETIVGALSSTRSLSTERGVKVELDLPERPAWLECDRDRLHQVVVNLVSNALKFVPEGSGLVRVSLARWAPQGASPSRWMVSVEDNGPGVPEKFRANIFDKFQQAADDLKARPQGTGLGLAICRTIVERFGGEIWLGDAEIGGTAVRFTLPVASTAQASDDERAIRTAAS